MKRLTLLGCALVVAGSSAQAQSSDHDFAAWFGLMVTPVGALPQIETTAGGRTDAPQQLAFRLSRWKFSGADVTENTFAVSYLAPSTSLVRYGVTAGWLQPTGGGGNNDGAFLIGGDLSTAVLQMTKTGANTSSFSVDVKGSMGYSRLTGSSGGNAWSIVAQVPAKWMYEMANKSTLSAFVSAGFGLAGLSDEFDKDHGTRPMFSFGGAWTSAAGVGVHLGAQKVPLDFGPTSDGPPFVTGLAVTFPVGAKK
jgi:hypothetical protein